MKKFVAAAVCILSGCSGQLLIESPNVTRCEDSSQCGIGLVCDSTLGQCVESDGPCSVALPNGDCPAGRECDAGICVCRDPETCGCSEGDCTTNGSDFCDCAANEYCTLDGLCEAVTEENACSLTAPTGLCLGGEVCAGGNCVPVDENNACTPERPDGLCPAALSCDRGYCIPARDLPCSPQALNGFCPAAQSCSSAGVCVVQGCSPETPFGACDTDERCLDGICVGLPCDSLHPAGVCEDGFYCASNTQCIPTDQCAGNDDCESVEYCGLVPVGETADPICLSTDVCRFDEDCESVVGQGFTCNAGACEPRSVCTTSEDCIVGSFCSAGGICRAPGQCDESSDCENNEFCSVEVNLCTPVGECRVSSDCTAPQLCSRVELSPTCIDPDTCQGDADCPPGTGCNAGACEVNVASCSSNGVSSSCPGGESICCPDGESCCASGERCSLQGTTEGLCIPQGECRDGDDCPSGFSCNDSFRCEPSGAQSCTSNAECAEGELCKASGVCLSPQACVSVTDCLSNEVCSARFQCEPVPNPACGFDSFALGGILPPNVLIVVDRSASMNLCGPDTLTTSLPADRGACGNTGDDCNCCSSSATGAPPCAVAGCDVDTVCASGVFPTCRGACSHDASACVSDAECGMGNRCENTIEPGEATRWDQAVSAIDTLITDQAGQVAFGLSRYPQPTGTESCALGCNLLSCSDLGSTSGGAIDVSVDLTSQAAIRSALENTGPGGATPTSPTLRAITALPDLGGLDDLDRANAVILVTDGQALGDTADVRVCEPACGNSIQDDSETDVDCGGLCPACTVGQSCASDLDCESGSTCPDGTCRAASCFDGMQNGDEVSVDCGGSCPACAEGDSCTLPSDCQSGVCSALQCAAPRCDDGVRNANETAVDCGGGCDTKCPDGESCGSDADCENAVCQDALCRPEDCDDGIMNGEEIAVDCGGTVCGPCPETGSCFNATQDGDETDVDCGGSCGPCTAGLACSAGADCASSSCRICSNEPGNENGCRVDAALDRLYAENNRIRTFVVGFEFQGVVSELNCYAAHGRTSRTDSCPDATTSNCAAQSDACYFTADDTQSLVDAFDTVVDQVTSCVYDVSSAPLSADPNLANIYLDFDLGDGASLSRTTRLQDWVFRPGAGTVEFFGEACDALLAGSAVPLIVYGCRDFGG